MPFTASPKIYYETSGDPKHPPLMLIEGLGAQLLGWPAAFVDRLVARDFFVVRLDNRDVGLSEMFGGPDVVVASYTLADMAEDVVRTMEALGLRSAHVVGQSMGGAIAQTLALGWPERVQSMTLIYTAPAFDPRFVSDEIQKVLSSDMAGAIPGVAERRATLLERARLCASTNRPFDEAAALDLIDRSLSRCDRPDGVARQTSVMMNAGDWTDELGQISVPTAIIHGRADRLVKTHAAYELSRLIPESELHIYPGMGHEIAKPLWDDFVSIIVRGAAAGRAPNEAVT